MTHLYTCSFQASRGIRSLRTTSTLSVQAKSLSEAQNKASVYAMADGWRDVTIYATVKGRRVGQPSDVCESK